MVRFLLALLCAVSATTICHHAYADDTLSLDLPPSQRALDQRAADKARTAMAEATQRAATRQSVHTATSPVASRGSLPSRSGAPDRIVGRLGEIQQRTSIFRTQRASGRLAIVDAGTYIAIKDESAQWYGVLMQDGSTGWISKSYVHLLDYQVVSNGAQSLPNFGDGTLQPRYGGEYFTGDPQALFREAYKYLGVPYQWGGNTEAGIDCSGFVKRVFAACGYSLPRTAAEQTGLGLPIPIDSLQAGDRLYFGHGTRITHTGLYIGNGYFIHSSAGQHGVAISKLTDQTYLKIFICARR